MQRLTVNYIKTLAWNKMKSLVIKLTGCTLKLEKTFHKNMTDTFICKESVYLV